MYGWSTCVGAIISELASVLRETTDLPVKEQAGNWDPLHSMDDTTLFVLLVPQTVTVYPMYYVTYQTEQWGTFFLDEGSTSWGTPRGRNATATYKEVRVPQLSRLEDPLVHCVLQGVSGYATPACYMSWLA